MTLKIELKISKESEKKLKEKIKGTDFSTIKEYIMFILEQVISETETEKEIYTEEEEEDIAGSKAYTLEDEEALKKNLEDMGYL